MSRLAGVVLGAALAMSAGAQDRERCIFDNTPQTRTFSVELPSGQRNTFIGGGVVVRCPSRDVRLRGDSLESYGDEGRIFLLGHVSYDEPRLSLTSDYLTYYQRTERIVATGNVVSRSPRSGSTLRGPIVDYFRSIPDSRPATRLVATQRPTITLIQRDSAGRPSDTLVVLTDRVTMIGDSLVYAGGNVVMTRTDVEARGDSVFIDSESELMVLMRGPSITGRSQRPFTLTGTRIELTTSNRKLARVFSMGDAKATSEDVTLISDTIDLRLADDLLQRAIAWGPRRANASSTSQQILADSIDVLMPGQRIRELHAVRGAAAEAQPDTARFKADTVDWLRGDTIIALFDTTAARDTTRSAQIRELLARGTARSYYHLTPADTTVDSAAINYVRGRQIVVAFQDRRASRVTVVDKASGVYVEPRPKARPAGSGQRAASADSSRRVPATAPPAARPPSSAARRPPPADR